MTSLCSVSAVALFLVFGVGSGSTMKLFRGLQSCPCLLGLQNLSRMLALLKLTSEVSLCPGAAQVSQHKAHCLLEHCPWRQAGFESCPPPLPVPDQLSDPIGPPRPQQALGYLEVRAGHGPATVTPSSLQVQVFSPVRWTTKTFQPWSSHTLDTSLSARPEKRKRGAAPRRKKKMVKKRKDTEL